MLLKKNKKKKFFIFLLTLIVILVSIYQIKFIRLGNIDQELRIFLKQPVLFSTYASNDRNISHLFYALKNFFSKKNFEKIKLDIPFKNFEILKKNRNDAKKKGILRNPKKVDAEIVWKNKVYPAVVRLKGDYNDHIEYNKQWSLKVNLKNNRTIKNFNEFSLTSHSTRAYPDSFINSNFLRKIGIITPEISTVSVEVNGEDWGLMAIEENLSSIFLEIRNKKSVPIFKLSNEEHMTISSKIMNKYKKKENNKKKIINNLRYWQGLLEVETYNKNKIYKKTNIPNENTNFDLFSTMQTINNYIINRKNSFNYNYNLNDKDILKYFDIKKFALLIASNLVWGEVHSLYNINSRFYIDPYTLKINPIPTDFHYIQTTLGLKRNDVRNLNENELSNIKFFDPIAEIYKFVIRSDEFKEEYISALRIIENNFQFIYDEMETFCKPFGEICTKENQIYGFALDDLKKQKLRENLKFLKHFGKRIFDNLNSKNPNNFTILTKNLLNQNLDLVKKKIFVRLFDNGEIEIFNLTQSEIIIDKLIIYDKKNCFKEKCKNKLIFKSNKILNLNPSDQSLSTIDLLLHKDFSNNEIFKSSDLMYYDIVEVYFKNKISNKFEKLKFEIEDQKFSKTNLINKPNILPEFFLKEKNFYIIKQGNYLVDSKIVLPKKYGLIIDPGVNIKFSNDSYIFIEDGFIEINGSESDHVYLSAKDKYWSGLHLSNCIKPSKIKYTNFSNLNYFKHSSIQLTGGINFYNCEIDILNSKFRNSFSEDFINIINSNFTLENIELYNSNSDAIDLDFANGNIKNAYLSNIKGDAVDTSGSKIKLTGINIKNVRDKSISAGEKSDLTLKNINISNSNIGIASKDSSVVRGDNINILNSNTYDLTAFRKKNFYDGGLIYLKDVNYENKNLIQIESFAEVNNKIIKTKKFNSKLLYK